MSRPLVGLVHKGDGCLRCLNNRQKSGWLICEKCIGEFEK